MEDQLRLAAASREADALARDLWNLLADRPETIGVTLVALARLLGQFCAVAAEDGDGRPLLRALCQHADVSLAVKRAGDSLDRAGLAALKPGAAS